MEEAPVKRFELILPGATDAELIRWNVKEGSDICEGQDLCAYLPQGATRELRSLHSPFPFEGVIRELIPEKSHVRAGYVQTLALNRPKQRDGNREETDLIDGFRWRAQSSRGCCGILRTRDLVRRSVCHLRQGYERRKGGHDIPHPFPAIPHRLSRGIAPPPTYAGAVANARDYAPHRWRSAMPSALRSV